MTNSIYGENVNKTEVAHRPPPFFGADFSDIEQDRLTLCKTWQDLEKEGEKIATERYKLASEKSSFFTGKEKKLAQLDAKQEALKQTKLAFLDDAKALLAKAKKERERVKQFYKNSSGGESDGYRAGHAIGRIELLIEMLSQKETE